MKSKITTCIFPLSGVVSVFTRVAGMKSYLLCLFFLYCGSAAAQAPVLLSSQKFSAIGAGATGVPTVNFNIPAGTNRLLVVSAVFERNHTAFSNNNWPRGTAAAPLNDLTVSVGGVSATYLDGGGAMILGGVFSLSSSFTYLRDTGGLPTGNTAITFPNLKLPLTAGDEMSVIVSVYENTTSITTVSSAINHFVTNSNNVFPITDVPAVPAGYDATDVVYLTSGATTEAALLTLGPLGQWTLPATMNNLIANNAGSTSPIVGYFEPDGLSHVMGYRSASGMSTPSLRRSGTGTGDFVVSKFMFALIPPLPAFSGTVHKDITGPTTIEGAVTDAGGTYINVINAANNLVYSAPVSALGAFSVPSNLVTPGSSYRLEISKNTGTPGQPAPLKELNSGWTTVGESAPGPVGSMPNGSDGSNDGIINVVAAASPITGLRFGVNDCPTALSESVFTKTDALNSLKTDGSITISGLTPATVYTASYRFDQVPQRALTFTPGSGGTWTITGFTPGEYSHFSIRNTSAGCTSSAPLTFSLSIN